MPYPYKLEPLPYAYDALEPYLDARTFEIHHAKHHQAYINGLNKTVESYPQLHTLSIHDLLANLDQVPVHIRQAVINFGGGAYHHEIFWHMMSPSGVRMPTGLLAQAIDATFGSYKQFRAAFTQAAQTLFGSGWVWLCVDNVGALSIVQTGNQESPISQGKKILMGIDVWEHAYYLKFQNKRVDFIDAWWHVADWIYAQHHFS